MLIIFLNKNSLLPKRFVELELKGEVAMFFCLRVALLLLSVSCGSPAFLGVGASAANSAARVDDSAPSGDVIATPHERDEGTVERRRLAWHFPCEDTEAWSWGDYSFIGQGVYSKNMRGAQTLELTISGILCDTRYLPRDVVFVIDTSASMRENDPRAKDGSCARSQAMDQMSAYLSHFENARVGLVTYNSTADELYNHLVPAGEFYKEYVAQHARMEEFLCHADNYTNYRNALLKTERLLNTGRTNSFREIYFFSDGEPQEAFFSSLDPAGLDVARRLRKSATIATVGLGKTGILEEDIASRVNGKPLHRQAEQLNELFILLRELVQTKNIGAELTYRYLGAAAGHTIDIHRELNVGEGEFFQLSPLLFTIDADDPEKNKGIIIEIKYWDSNGNTYHASGEIHFTF